MVLRNKGTDGTDEESVQEQLPQLCHGVHGSCPGVAGDPVERTRGQQHSSSPNNRPGHMAASDDHHDSCAPVRHEVFGYKSGLKWSRRERKSYCCCVLRLRQMSEMG